MATSAIPAAAAAVVDGSGGKLAAFVGSGISLFAPTSLPSWWGFIKAVIFAVGGATGTDAGASLVSEIITALDGGKLPPYVVTDVMARRLGDAYLQAMPALFTEVPFNAIHSWLAASLLGGKLGALATTNFDQAIEAAITAQGGDMIRLSGNWADDRRLLASQWERVSAAASAADSGGAAPLKPVVVVPTFAAFQSLTRVSTLIGRGTHAFILKVHGDAAVPTSCIDTEYQRVQGLPATVADILTHVLHQLPMLFLGFSGADLDASIDYLRLASEGDQATIHWLLRDGQPEPANLFARLRASVGNEKFHVHRGDFLGEIPPAGSNKLVTSRLSEWAATHVGSLWASIVLADLARAAGIGAEPIVNVLAPLLPAGASLAAGALPDVDDLLLRFARVSAASGAAAADASSIGDATRKQVAVAVPCGQALEALARVISASGDADDAAADGVVAVTRAVQAVMAQRTHFADSRLLPDAWVPITVLAAALAASGQLEDAQRFFNSAVATTGIAGHVHARAALEGARSEIADAIAAQAAAAGIDAITASADAAASVVVPSAAAVEEETKIFVPFFDNTANFAFEGVPVSTVLRAHLHRALLLADAIAMPPQFLLNCRPFIAEVLCKPGADATAGAGAHGAGDASSTGAAAADASASATPINLTYLAHIRPLLPTKQMVDFKGTRGKVEFNLKEDPHPLLTFRRECQLNNPVFLAERIPEHLIAAIDAFYAANRHLIIWYELGTVASKYGARTCSMLQRHDTLSQYFDDGIDKAAAVDAMPPTLTFVQSCLSTGGLTRSLMYRFCDLFRYPVTERDFADGCTKQLAALDAGTVAGAAAPAATDAAASAAASAQLLKRRAAISAAPWKYGDVLRDASDAAYVTALPLTLGLSLVLEGRDELLVHLTSAGLLEEAEPVRILDAVSVDTAAVGGAEPVLRVVELASLSPAALAALRSSPEAVALRTSIAHLRRRAAKATASGVAGGDAGAMSPRLGAAGGAAATIALAAPTIGGASSGACKPGPTIGAPLAKSFSRNGVSRIASVSSSSGSALRSRGMTLRHTPSTGSDSWSPLAHAMSASVSGVSEEVRLNARVSQAAADLFNVVQARLGPVDQEPLPQIDVPAVLSSVEGRAGNVAIAAAILRVLYAAKKGSPAPPAASPLQLARDIHVTVCKGDPIPPTYSMPSLAFPGLLPVVKLKPASQLVPVPAAVSPPAAAAAGTAAAGGSVAHAVATSGAALAGAATAAGGMAPSPSSPPIKCLEEVTVYDDPVNKWVSLRFDRVEFPGGKLGRHNIVVEFGGRPGPGVVVLPITASGDIILLRQYRYCVKAFSWEVPRGGPEHGKQPIEQALAELEEETGYTTRADDAAAAVAGLPASKMVAMASSSPDAPLGALLWANTGISNTTVAYFAALHAHPLAAGARPEETEAIGAVKAFTPEQVYEMVRDGEIADQFTVCALSLGVMHGFIPPPHF